MFIDFSSNNKTHTNAYSRIIKNINPNSLGYKQIKLDMDHPVYGEINNLEYTFWLFKKERQ